MECPHDSCDVVDTTTVPDYYRQGYCTNCETTVQETPDRTWQHPGPESPVAHKYRTRESE